MEQIPELKPYTHTVQYYETDKMGVVHHSNYIRWMEEARIDFFDQIGWSYKAFEDAGLISPVTAVQCRYKHTSTFGDRISVMIHVVQFRNVRLTLGYTMRNEAGAVVCEGQSEHCFLDGSGQIVRLNREYPAFAEILTQMQQDAK